MSGPAQHTPPKSNTGLIVANAKIGAGRIGAEHESAGGCPTCGHEASERHRGLYLAGLVQGREDALAARRAAPKGIDSGYLVGYFHGFDGWMVAMRNERRKARRAKP